MKAPAKSSGSSSPAAFIPEASLGEGEGLALGPIATIAQVRRNHV